VEAILRVPEGTDEAVWQYEHLRQFTLEFNHLVVLFDPVCNEVRMEERAGRKKMNGKLKMLIKNKMKENPKHNLGEGMSEQALR
jgi:hypothetical protein